MDNLDNIEINNLDTTDLPFFARFLEGQMEDVSEVESASVAGGSNITSSGINKKFLDMAYTNKYPSDGDDQGGGVVTQRYPSDHEEIAQTSKYPSDNEDHAGGGNPPMTKKYPSDREEGWHFHL
jgi:Serine endopeptidase inhibitors